MSDVGCRRLGGGYSSETSMTAYQTTLPYTSEDSTVNSSCIIQILSSTVFAIYVCNKNRLPADFSASVFRN
jgi:hypothetical protein